jgi:PPOX class probable F420-dependent enzyme
VTDIAEFTRLIGADHGLCVVSVLGPDGTIHSSVVNAGVLPHPTTGRAVVGFVVRGGARKVAYLRAHPRATVLVRAGWEWAAAEGPVGLIGPDEPADPGLEPGVDDAGDLRVLLRKVFLAAGGTHDDWDTYDAVMAAERRVAVLVDPVRIYSNR